MGILNEQMAASQKPFEIKTKNAWINHVKTNLKKFWISKWSDFRSPCISNKWWLKYQTRSDFEWSDQILNRFLF